MAGKNTPAPSPGASSGVLSEFASKDPSWGNALGLVQKRLELSSSLWWLFRGSWNGGLTKREFLRSLGFSRLNLASLIEAAGLGGSTLDAAAVDRALDTLGVRLASVVLAINYACQAVLSAKPPPVWKKLFQEIMNRIEIGYRLGGKIPPMGVEGGALMGFASGIGAAILMAANPSAFKKWYQQPGVPFPAEVFGCEPYQVSAFVLQQLGFGHEIAIGAALASDKLDLHQLDLDERTCAWHAALMWIEALRDGRSYPSNPELRQTFPEIAPPREPQGRNVTLEVLYTEVAKVRGEGSKWTWHLPKPGYDESAKTVGI